MRGRVLWIHLLSVTFSRAFPLVLYWLILREFHATVLALAEGEPENPYLQLLTSLNNIRSFAFLLGILGVFYGLQQRALRRRAAAEFARTLASISPAKSGQS